MTSMIDSAPSSFGVGDGNHSLACIRCVGVTATNDMTIQAEYAYTQIFNPFGTASKHTKDGVCPVANDFQILVAGVSAKGV